MAPINLRPPGLRQHFVALSISLLVLCTILDGSMVPIAVPRVANTFHALGDMGWYAASYLLTQSMSHLYYAKVYPVFDIKTVFIAAAVIFLIGSLVSATAPSSLAFIFGRAITGVGAAGILQGSLFVTGNISTDTQRAITTALAFAIRGLAYVSGLFLGGAFTDRVTWRWSFFLNIILGGVSLLGVFLMQSPSPAGLRGSKAQFLRNSWRLDSGVLLVFSSTVCLLIAIQWGGTVYAWDNSRVIVLFVLSGMLLCAFLGVQAWLGDRAIVDLRIADDRKIAFISILALFRGGVFFLFTYLLPLYFQAIRGVNALRSGIDMVPLALATSLAIFFTIGLTKKIWYHLPCVCAGVVLTAVGAGLLTTLDTNTSTWTWVAFLIVCGLGHGCTFNLPFIAAQVDRRGRSIAFFADSLGGALFVGIGNSILDNKLVKNVGALNIPDSDPKAVIHLGATEVRSHVPEKFVFLTIQAYNHAIVDALYVALVIACLSVLAVLVTGLCRFAIRLTREKQYERPAPSNFPAGVTTTTVYANVEGSYISPLAMLRKEREHRRAQQEEVSGLDDTPVSVANGDIELKDAKEWTPPVTPAMANARPSSRWSTGAQEQLAPAGLSRSTSAPNLSDISSELYASDASSQISGYGYDV